MQKDHGDNEDKHFTVLSPDGHVLRTFHHTLLDALGYLYTADKQYFLTVDWEMHASLWNHNLSERQGHFLLKSDAVDIQDPRFFEFTPDSRYVFFLSCGHIVRCMFDWKKKSLIEMIALSQSGSDMEVLEISPDGHALAGSDTGHNCVDLYDASSLNRLISFPIPVEELPQRFAFSPDGNFLACVGSKGSVYIGSTRDFHCVNLLL
ncbi:WD40 repeat domain-containing protein [Ktedonospora formicarum]|uniref:Uncharacterized protein n=1 Tax=Ktedonospora formicarum TaxID=2778364 RepID=A0A8J3IBQ9_9CHLR|nr:WD40 repeat domain-containing protein [Ktedonospora formicarum]GHO49747.1 hypothetical protein KSX_79100 [Ktedonospora formicarum]